MRPGSDGTEYIASVTILSWGGAHEREIIQSGQHIVKSYRIGETPSPSPRGFPLTVEEGEFLAILGPSGSVKSTLMNIVGCMWTTWTAEPISWTAIFGGDCSDDELTHIRNQKIGFIFQKYQLIPSTQCCNVMMPLPGAGMSSRQAEESRLPTIEMLGLTERLSHKPRGAPAGSSSGLPSPGRWWANLASSWPTNPLAPPGFLHRAGGVGTVPAGSTTWATPILMITHDLNVAKQARQVVRIVDGELF